MVKKVISIATVFLMLCCMIPFGAFADDILDVCPKCGERTYETWTDFSTTVPELGFPLSGKYRHCTSCGYTYYDWNCLGFAGYKDFDNGGEGFFLDYIKNWCTKTFGQNATATKAPTGIGRKDLPGYASDDGTPAVDSDGFPSSTFSMELNGVDSPYGFSLKLPLYNTNYYDGSYFKQLTYGSFSTSGGNASCYSIQPSGNEVDENSLIVSYYFIAPFSGYYDFTTPSAKFYCILKDASGVSSNGSIYTRTNFTILPASTDFSKFSDSVVSKPSTKGGHFSPYVSDSVQYTRYLAKGEILYLNYYNYYHSDYGYNYPYKYLSIQTSTPTITGSNYECNIVSNDTLTINNNTWNGNIYVDNSNNLTYIYPQYTTINEKNETVTNISNNPIIYNNETKQYYTYDTVTNNYYYITYEQPATPTPSPSLSPSPSPTPTETSSPSESPAPTPTPDPGENPTPTPTPGGGTIITPGGDGSGSGSGSSSGITGGDDEGLFGWLWDLLKDLVKAILKAIFKVLSGLLGFLIWLVERVGILLPFLPAPAIAALGAGVVLVFVIRIIRFIRG